MSILLNKPKFYPKHLGHIKLWLDASDIATITKDGSDKVSQWNDKSGNGNHATQGTGAAQPTWTANQQNGKAVITFDSSDDWIAANAVASVGTGDRTIFIVAKPTAQTDVGVITALQTDGDGSTNQSKLEVWTLGQIRHTQQANTNLDTNDWEDTPFILTTTFQGTTLSARINGKNSTDPTAATIELLACNEFSIGQEFDAATPSNFYGGDIAEIIIYGRALSASETMLVNQYLSSKWGISFI